MDTRFSLEPSAHGTGGFAKVIKGRDNVLERDVAIKVLNPLATKFPETDQERFRREARILAKLSHPNIPSIYDIDFSPGKFLIIFQFINGVNLRRVIENDGPTPLGTARAWFTQIASALDHSHALGVIHRDIKPENLIIAHNKEAAYVADFGIALTREDTKHLTEEGYVIGTPGYMSPEQQAGEELDYRTDIYSLAVTFYETLAGKPVPFAQYQALSTLNESIPPQVDDLILDCLVTKDKRTLSAQNFIQRLSTAFVPTRPLSEILAHGKLHELCSALEEMSAGDFLNLPVGQRALILAKTSDVVRSGESALVYAGERLLQLLLLRTLLLPQSDYKEIVAPFFKWAYEQQFGNFTGSNAVRLALEKAAQQAKGASLAVIEEECANLFAPIDFSQKQEWYMHNARLLVQTILANPACSIKANELVRIFKKINEAQRGVRAAASVEPNSV
jgi:serine/threonine-protein kinase